MSNRKKRVKEALEIVQALGLPRAQWNERTALCLLALLGVKPGGTWASASAPLIGITPIMKWIEEHYGKKYAPNTREMFRRQSMHQFCDAGVAAKNPDQGDREVNNPKTAYQIDQSALSLIRKFGSANWPQALAAYMKDRQSLIERYAKEREQNQVPVRITEGKTISLSPGEHSELIRDIIESFVPRFAPNSELIYVGDTGDKFGFFDAPRLAELGVEVDAHGKMPDVVVYYTERDWLLLIESVTSHGPVDGKRHDELAKQFASAKSGRVYVTAFPDRVIMKRYLGDIAWETEVWIADAPSHMIHFNGTRFLGPYDKKKS